MQLLSYVNGEYPNSTDAKISILDRGFLFADGVYEVCTVLQGKLIDNTRHLARLRRSLNELSISLDLSDADITGIQQHLIQHNQLQEGMIYLQVTRGSDAQRSFEYPKNPESSLVMFTQTMNIIDNPVADRGISIITVDDVRWARCDIKTVSLLAASMAKMAAKKQNADDAWFVEDGLVTEGSSNNAYIVTNDNTIITRHLGTEILGGITRQAVIEIAEKEGLSIEQRAFSVEEAGQAREAFSSSATATIMPVIKINDKVIGSGKPGPITTMLRKQYLKLALSNQYS